MSAVSFVVVKLFLVFDIHLHPNTGPLQSLKGTRGALVTVDFEHQLLSGVELSPNESTCRLKYNEIQTYP